MVQYNMQVRYVDKKLILKHVSEEDIFEYYLGVPVDLKDGVNSDLFCSPIRPDHRPTCKFFITSHGKLYFHDFSGHFSGDCFSLVQMLFNVNYGQALNYIAKDLQILDERNIVTQGRKERVFTERNAKPRMYSRIGINKRKWNDHDRRYWEPYGITPATLSHFNVFGAEKVYLKNRLNYSYDYKDPAYAYFFGNQQFKIYFPLRKLFRFLCNTDIWQGYQQLPEKGDFLIITKSLKDVMSLYEMQYTSIAPQGETINLTEKFVSELKERFKEIVLLYDDDEAGNVGTQKAKEQFGLECIKIPKQLGSKDISDVVKDHGINEANEVMHRLLDL